MSWPRDEKSQNFDASDSQSQLSSDVTSPAQHHPRHLKKHKTRKQDKSSKAKLSIEVVEGKFVSDNNRLTTDIHSLPEPETDTPVYTVTSGLADKPPKFRNVHFSDNQVSHISWRDKDNSKKKIKSCLNQRPGKSSSEQSSHTLPDPDSPVAGELKSNNNSLEPLREASSKSQLEEDAIKAGALVNPYVKSEKTNMEPIQPSQAAKSDQLKVVAEEDVCDHLKFRKGSTSRFHTSGAKEEEETVSDRDDVVNHLEQLRQSRKMGTAKHTNRLIIKDKTSHFIVDKIRQCECHRFVKDNSEPKNNMCACGRTKSWHEQRNHPTEETLSRKWHPKTDNTFVSCDCFGEIHFRGFGSNVANSPYARVDFSTEPSVIWELLIDHWNMPRPRLLISVTGGAQRFELKPRLSALLKQGLVEAAVNTGAWIITGGTATGVMEFVGEAVRDHYTVAGKGRDEQCVALGIATWGCVANKLALDGEGENGLWPATYAIEDVVNPPKGFSALDANHSHFLLVDNGCEGLFGAEIAFRSELESYISEVGTTGVSESQVIHTPAVLIVVEGGIGTMETMYQSVKRNTPVVVISGSGRAADFIAEAYRISHNPNNPEVSKLPSDFDSKLKLAANTIFVWKAHDTNKDRKIEDCIGYLKQCLKKRNLINVFNLQSSDSARDIDRAILYALLKANKFDCKSQLALALAWNRCDIARQQIFIPENRSKWEIRDLYDAMFTALVQNRTDFVQLFIDNGVDLKKFLTTKTLWNLYCNCLNFEEDSEASILRHMIMYVEQGWVGYLRCQALEEWSGYLKSNILHSINRVIVHLLKNACFDFYTKDKHSVLNEKPSMEWKGDMRSIQPLLTRLSSQTSNKGRSLPPNDSAHQAQDSQQTTSAIALTVEMKSRRRQSSASDSEESGGPISRSKRMKQRMKMKENFDFEHPERDLFIFAILFNRRKMSAFFLHQGIDHIGTSLLGASLLKAVSIQAEMDEETSISLDLWNHARSMENFARSVLDQCYQRSKIDSHLLLTRKIKQLGNTTALLMADQQELMDFAEHSACQTMLTAIWKGCLTLHTSELKVLVTIFLPFLIFFMKFDKFGKSKLADTLAKEEAPESSQQENGAESKKSAPTQFTPSKNQVHDTTKHTIFRVVRVTACGGENAIGVVQAFYKFYTAPVTKFYANIIAYLIFLCLFSYFLITNLKPDDQPDSPSPIEYVVWFWLATMVIEDGRQVILRKQRSIRYKIRNWWSNFWNKFDVVMYLCIVTSIILRYRLSDDRFIYARIMYSISLAMLYLRFMQFFFAEKNMGPKVIMIRRMLTDLMFFFMILLVFVLSFGVAYHINMFPNSPISWTILANVLYYPYFQIYGELFLDNLGGEEVNGCTRNESIWQEDPSQRCPEKNAIVLIMLAVYMILINILLVNLLIAMFSYTFQTVQEVSTKVWRFYRIALVYEYFDRPTLVPPIIFINHLWYIIRYLLRKMSSIGVSKQYNAFALSLPEDDNVRLTLFEKAALEVHLAHSSLLEREQLDNRVASTADRLEMVMDDLQRIKEAVQQQDAHAGEGPTADNAGGLPETAWENVTADSAVSDLKFTLASPGSQVERQENAVLNTHLKNLQHQVTKNSLMLSEITSLLQEIRKEKE